MKCYAFTNIMLVVYMIFSPHKCRHFNGLWRNRWRWWFPGGVCLPVLCRIVWYHWLVLSHRWWTYFRVKERGITLSLSLSIYFAALQLILLFTIISTWNAKVYSQPCALDFMTRKSVILQVCPVCSLKVGVDIVAHITLHHGSLFKISFFWFSTFTDFLSSYHGFTLLC